MIRLYNICLGLIHKSFKLHVCLTSYYMHMDMREPQIWVCSAAVVLHVASINLVKNGNYHSSVLSF